MSVYGFSDLHGRLDLYEKIKEFVKPTDKLYFLGDANDRGPDSWELIKTLAKDEQVTYLKGNHEDMLVQAIREAINGDMDGRWGCKHQRLLASNGGMYTLEDALQEDDAIMWSVYLNKLPTNTMYTNTNGQNIFLSHAGCTYAMEDTIPKDNELLWDRMHFYDNPKFCGDVIAVHGHTPIDYLAEEIGVPIPEGALKYADGKKYCIDAGSFFTGQAILLNLDTFESIVFTA